MNVKGCFVDGWSVDCGVKGKRLNYITNLTLKLNENVIWRLNQKNPNRYIGFIWALLNPSVSV